MVSPPLLPAFSDHRLAVLPFSGKIMGKERSYVFDFLVTKAPAGYGSVQNTIQHFDVISSTLVFLDGVAAQSSDLAVGQEVTVYLEVLPGGGFNAVARRVMAYSAINAGAGTSSVAAPLAGKTFVYVKRLPKDSGWHSAKPKENTLMVRVFPGGKTVQIRWLLWTGTGCGGVDTDSGRRYSYPVGVGIVTTLNPNGTFHVVDTRPFMPGTRYHRAEVYGQFGARGSYARLRLRQKLDVITPSSRFRCDGRWLRLQVPLKRSGSSSAPAPKPTPPLYEVGRYRGRSSMQSSTTPRRSSGRKGRSASASCGTRTVAAQSATSNSRSRSATARS